MMEVIRVASSSNTEEAKRSPRLINASSAVLWYKWAKKGSVGPKEMESIVYVFPGFT